MNIALYSNSMQAGKSTVAEYLVSLGYKRVKFARTLKAMLVPFLLNFVTDPWEYLEGSKKENKIPGLGGITARLLMQTLGQEWGRMCVNNDIWVIVETTNLNLNENYVVDDMRYDNEFQKLRELGFILVKLVGRGELTRQHGSEGNLDAYPFDHVITNDGSIEDLLSQIDQILK